MVDLLDVKIAQNLLLQHFQPVGVESSPVDIILGRVLAEDIISPMDLPPFSNSSMDGFGVQSGDLVQLGPGGAISLKVVGEVPAGEYYTDDILPGEAVRIMTGAPVPDCIDAVVPIEFTNLDYMKKPNGPQEYISVLRKVRPGDYIRKRGDDLKKGDLVLKEGRILKPQDIGLLSMLGFREIKVFAKPKVAIFSTGSELLNPSDDLSQGKIFDSNRPMLFSLLDQFGVDVIDYGIICDDENELISLFNRIDATSVDLILTSGGVSVGLYDYVRKVIEANGKLEFWRVNMRPGKPIAFGYYKNTPIIGLPGNPVSAYIGFIVFVEPVLEKLSNLELIKRKICKVRIKSSIESDGRETYFRAKIFSCENELYAELTGEQGSGNLNSLVQADSLVIIPAGVYSLPEGSLVEAWILDESFTC